MSVNNGRLSKRTERSSPASRNTTEEPSHTFHTGKKDKGKQKTFMDNWVEPPIAEKASFEENGCAPYGVLEYVQPLGTLPSAKVKSRVKPDAPRKSVAGKSSAGAAADAQETPDGTPSFEAPPSASRPENKISVPPLVVIDDEDDRDYAPKRVTKPPSVPSRSSRAGKTSSTEALSSRAAASLASFGLDPSKFSQPKKTSERRLKQIVAHAVERAQQVGNPTLGDAVKEIHEESKTDPHLRNLLEGVLSKTMKPREHKEFQEYVKRTKKRLRDRRDRAAEVDARTPQAVNSSTNGVSTSSHSTSATKTSSRPRISRAAAVESTENLDWRSKTETSVIFKSQEQKAHANGKATKTSTMSSKGSKKRSGSVSSQSSLTSLTSNGEEATDVGSADAENVKESSQPSQQDGAKFNGRSAGRDSLAVSQSSHALKRSSAEAELPYDERDDVLAAKKQKLRENITRDHKWDESAVREAISKPAVQPMASNSTRTKPRSAGFSLMANARYGYKRRSIKATSSDGDSQTSALTPLSSRQSTPHIARGPTKTTGKRAKTKTSPEKKHTAADGRLSGAGGARRESPIGYDDNEELSDNNDFCSACGGSGFLLCCDGCDRSFHFTCLDPPLKQDSQELDEPWFCFICVAKRPVTAEQPEKPPRGLFAPLLTSLNKRNPSTFSLPPRIREYFEGVATEKTGQFVEAVNTKTRASNRTGWEELPDYLKTKDNKGTTIMCYSCNQSTTGRREIIPCDYCGAHWHLDCLDPPLANAPSRGLNGHKVHDWMCPLHVDHELRQVDTRLLNRTTRKVHVRKPKNAKLVDTSLNRGFINNGIIEVIDDDSSDDSDFYEHEDEPVVYRMPARGIKMDFIDKVKRTRVEIAPYEQSSHTPRPRVRSQLAQVNFANRSIREKQAVLNLMQFAAEDPELGFGGDKIENLLSTVIAEAPSEVVDEMMAAEDSEKTHSASSAIPPSPPSSDKPEQMSAASRKDLKKLMELIQRKLDSTAKGD